MIKDVVLFPIKGWARAKNRRGKRSVSCIVTDRWLRFREEATTLAEGPVVFMDVMTDVSGDERKLCELCIPLDDLAKAVENIKIKK